MAFAASSRFWSTPELKLYVGKALDTQHDLLHFAQINKATCALMLPLLYENIRVAIDHVSQIEEIFRKYPEYARQCKRLRVESPDKIERSYLEGKRWRDKGMFENFQADPSRRYDAEFWHDWGKILEHSESDSAVSDPMEWTVGNEKDAEDALRIVVLNDQGHYESDSTSSSDGDWDTDDAYWSDEHGNEADDENDEGEDDEDDDIPTFGDDSGPETMASFHEGVDLTHSDGDDTSDERGYSSTGIPVIAYWRTLVEKHKNDGDPNWLREKATIERHIRYRQQRHERKSEGPARLKNACAALSLVLAQLSKSGRLVSFEWVWELSECRPWSVTGASADLWAAMEKNAPSLQKLVLKVFKGDETTWTSFASTNYQSLKILHLNMANANYWTIHPLHAMLKQLPELEALHLKLPRFRPIQGFSLAGTYPKLRYFFWESGRLEKHHDVGDEDPEEFFQRHLHIDTLHVDFNPGIYLNFKKDSILPRLRAISYGGVFTNLNPLGHIIRRCPIIAIRSRLPEGGLLSFVRLPAAASATVQWLDVKYYSNFRLDLATYGEALHTVPALRELTIRTRSERFDGRLTPLDIPDVLNAIPQDHPLTALTLYDPDGDALTANDLKDLPLIPSSLKYLGWETNEGRVLYALKRQGDKTTATEISYPRKQSWVWTQNSILDHSDGELWTDAFGGEVIPGLSQL